MVDYSKGKNLGNIGKITIMRCSRYTICELCLLKEGTVQGSEEFSVLRITSGHGWIMWEECVQTLNDRYSVSGVKNSVVCIE